MSSIGKLATLSVVFVLIAVGAGAAFSGAATNQTVEDEAILVDYNATTSVEYADLGVNFSTTVTIEDEFDTELEADTDYTWYPENGSVEWHDTSATDDGDTVYISYTYDGQSDQTRDIAGILRLTIWAGGLGLMLFGGKTALQWMGFIGGGR